MKTSLRIPLASLAVAVALGAAVPAFAHHPSASARAGTPIHDGAADRTIIIDPDTRWVNVDNGETVKFVVGDKSFAWRFDTLNQTVVDLSRIAPAGMLLDRSIKAYVEPDPRYEHNG